MFEFEAMQSDYEMSTMKPTDLYTLSRRGSPYYSVYDCHENEVFSFREASTKTIKGVYRICGRLSSSESPNIEVSVLKNVVGNGGSMEIKQYRDEPHMSSYHRAIAHVPTLKLYITSKLKSSEILLENEKEKFTWSADDHALFKVTAGRRLLAAKVEDADRNSESLSVLINSDIIQPHVAICFMFLREF